MANFENSLTGGVHPSLEKIASYRWPKPAGVMLTHGEAARVRGVTLERRPEDGPSDLDLVVTEENMKHIKSILGMHAFKRVYSYEDGPDINIEFLRSEDDSVEVFGYDFIRVLFEQTGRGREYAEQLIAKHDPRFDQDEHTGLYVASFDHIIATKMGTGRSQDARDIRRINQHKDYGI